MINMGSVMTMNDIIISIDDNKVESILEISTFINASTADTIEFIILRNDKQISNLLNQYLLMVKTL